LEIISDRVWHVKLKGALHSPYVDLNFILQLTFNDNFPVSPPEVMFIGTLPVHRYVLPNGKVVLSLLQ
jgi:ubiquitin-protein ligase